jgi:hypothetical protein
VVGKEVAETVWSAWVEGGGSGGAYGTLLLPTVARERLRDGEGMNRESGLVTRWGMAAGARGMSGSERTTW